MAPLCFGQTNPIACTRGLKAVKVCGVVSPEDADLVTSLSRRILPADTEILVGMILWPNSRRSVPIRTARQIASVARKAGATTVAVFVDETVREIHRTCHECGISVAQLHGPKCRSYWTEDGHSTYLRWIDVRDVAPGGSVSSPTASLGHLPSWTLFDAKGGGTGKPFDWKTFTAPVKPWLLAGGLDSENVVDAVRTLHPAGVDVASGVAGPDRCVKDEKRLELFLKRVVEAYS